MFCITRSYYFDMDFLPIITGVILLIQICFGQANNGPAFNINSKQDTQAPNTANTIQTNMSNMCGNFINLAAKHFNQKKSSLLQSGNRISDLLTQPSKAALPNHQNIIMSSVPMQQNLQQLPNLSQPQTQIQQQNNLETPEKPNISLGCLNLLQNRNINTLQTIPAGEPLPNTNILPAPNIENQPLQNTNNFVIPAALPNTPSISPSMTITTSLSPSIIPKNTAPQVFVQKQTNTPDPSVFSPHKVFVALREAPKSQLTVPTFSPNTEDDSESLNFKTLLPLILNLMTGKGSCTSCPRCNCCCNSNNNIREAAEIDSGYLSRRKYPYSSEEVEEDTSEELNRILVKRIKNKIYKAKRKAKLQRNNALSEEVREESQSYEDYYNN